MFTCYSNKTRIYHIYLPPGPVVAGYAVEACWEPPTITPVIDPANDFPTSANQDEPYHYRLVINNGQPITSCCCCGGDGIFGDGSCSDLWLELKQWGGLSVNSASFSSEPFGFPSGWNYNLGPPVVPCTTGTDRYSPMSMHFTWPYNPIYHTDGIPDGDYRSWGVVYRWTYKPGGNVVDQVAYTIFDVSVHQH
jgi:hypothetical protein